MWSYEFLNKNVSKRNKMQKIEKFYKFRVGVFIIAF
jgi:hypothetical protein